jgi:peroxiredoxin
MSLTKTPICDFGKKAESFKLKSTDNKIISLNDLKGEKGTLIMFICNHCPYVKAIIKDLVEDCKNIKKFGINSVAICSNDVKNYPEDSFENMTIFSKENNFSFPYLHDETQEVAKIYDAVCTPDFFAYNGDLELQYRGRIKQLKDLKPIDEGDSELFKALTLISKTGQGPLKQYPSMGCNIKWIK